MSDKDFKGWFLTYINKSISNNREYFYYNLTLKAVL